MKEPLVIYIDKSRISELGGVVDAIVPEYRVEKSDIRYIRQDFLLDKLAHAKALHEKTGCKNTEVFDALIELIKEL